MNKLILLLVLISGPVVAQDRNFNGDHISHYYMTGGYTNGIFKNTAFEPAPHPRRLAKTPQANLKAAADSVQEFDSYTLATVMIDRGKIVYQRYSRGTDENTEFNSWSMSKSITNILVGQALCNGDISSINDPAHKYVPGIKNTVYGQSTIRELLMMTSGATGQDPRTGSTLGSNYELTRGFKSQRDYILRDGLIYGPRGVWTYDGLHSNTLGLILDSLRGRKHYVQTFLNQAGVASKSHWFTDKDGHINAAFGLGLTLDDWARVAQLSMDMLHNQANIPNRDCVSKFMQVGTQSLVTPDEMKALNYTSYFGWGYTWTDPAVKHGYAWQGAFGQKAWFDPTTQRIVIQFRNFRNKEHSIHMVKFYRQWRTGHYD